MGVAIVQNICPSLPVNSNPATGINSSSTAKSIIKEHLCENSE